MFIFLARMSNHGNILSNEVMKSETELTRLLTEDVFMAHDPVAISLQ